MPNAALNKRAVDAYLTLGLNEMHPDVTLMWISDPDTTAHNKGIGSETTNESLRLVDAEIGRIEDTLRAKGLADRTNIIVTSDHGFSTHNSHLKLAALVAPFAQALPDGSPDIVVTEGAINFRAGADAGAGARDRRDAAAPARGRRDLHAAEAGRRSGRDRAGHAVVRGGALEPSALGGDPGVGELERGEERGGLRGEDHRQRRRRSRQLEPVRRPQHADRGGTGHPRARDQRRAHQQCRSAPTLLRLLGLKIPATMTGRVIEEALRNGPAIASVTVEHTTETVKTPDGGYTLTAHLSRAAGQTYLDFTDVRRR